MAELETLVDDITNALVSHAASIGYFDQVNLHEPKAKPGYGITCAIWLQSIGPFPAGSGLRSTSGHLIFNVRAYTTMLQDPQDAIDPNVLKAVATLMAAFSADFTLGGIIRNVDLLGAYGTSLRANAGYVNLANTLYRVLTITVPMIVNDVWPQSP